MLTKSRFRPKINSPPRVAAPCAAKQEHCTAWTLSRNVCAMRMSSYSIAAPSARPRISSGRRGDVRFEPPPAAEHFGPAQRAEQADHPDVLLEEPLRHRPQQPPVLQAHLARRAFEVQQPPPAAHRQPPAPFRPVAVRRSRELPPRARDARLRARTRFPLRRSPGDQRDLFSMTPGNSPNATGWNRRWPCSRFTFAALQLSPAAT